MFPRLGAEMLLDHVHNDNQPSDGCHGWSALQFPTNSSPDSRSKVLLPWLQSPRYTFKSARKDRVSGLLVMHQGRMENGGNVPDDMSSTGPQERGRKTNHFLLPFLQNASKFPQGLITHSELMLTSSMISVSLSGSWSAAVTSLIFLRVLGHLQNMQWINYIGFQQQGSQSSIVALKINLFFNICVSANSASFSPFFPGTTCSHQHTFLLSFMYLHSTQEARRWPQRL